MRVFTVPSSAPFLRRTIEALVDGDLVPGFEARSAPERLMHATMYLPTSRARTLARDIFLDVLGTEVAVLPRIFTFDGIDEDEISFSDVGPFGQSAALALPETLGEIERRMTLARLVAAWAKQLKPDDALASPLVVGGPASTLALAGDLARLMDDMVTRGVSYDALDGLVPEALDKYWQLTLDFLRIAKNIWPAHLAEIDRIEPMARRDLLIQAEADRLLAHQDGPVIAAGSTGSMPTTAKFLRAIAQMPQGAVVLPGLDLDLDEASWSMIGGTTNPDGTQRDPPSSNHAQHALFNLLKTIGITRADVRLLATPAPDGRELLASETMRPSNATAHWHSRLSQPDVATRIAGGMQRLAVIEAPTTELEAIAIATAMREAREHNKSAALVTPDRALARRVMAALARWNLTFDDSGGDALPDTPAGIFARLVAECAADQFEPAVLLSLLKHPMFRLGRAAGAWRRTIHHLELVLLRGTRPPAGSHGLASSFADFRSELTKLRNREPTALHRSEPRVGLDDDSLDAVADFITRLTDAFAPLERIGKGAHDFSELVGHHRKVTEALSQDDGSAIHAYRHNDGKALLKSFDDLAEQAPASGLMTQLSDYPDVFITAFGDRIVRRREVTNAHLRIYGTVEARLTEADLTILGGLVEGTWPPAPRVDPWLNRPMRHELGLDLPERRVGLSAHDFAQLIGRGDVLLSHAAKVGGAPAVASRFLHRLEAVAGKERWDAAVKAGARYVQYAEHLDCPDRVTPISKPMPRPPRAARPLRMSVTAIEDWLRDPYTIYARHILRLTALDPVDMPLSAADRGSAIHNAIGEFSQTYRTELPEDHALVLRRIGETHFAPLMSRPEARALWWPRFLRIADWVANWEIERRAELIQIDAETSGAIEIPLGDDRVFHLTARADRIERRADRTFAIVDFKTGNPPTGKQVRLGLSPQLTLEAAILRQGGFTGIPRHSSVSELVYVRLSGNNPPGEERVLELKLNKDDVQEPNDAADEVLDKLRKLIVKFEDEATPYSSLNLSMWATRYGAYDDLARIKEWSVSSEGDAS